MRIINCFFVLFIVSVHIEAQNIAVESFKPLPMDQTARITDPVIDQNGYKSALIKVVTTETGFSWDAGLLGITDIVQKVGEIWVYVPKGSRKITIKHKQHGVLRNYNYPDAINEASVYEMVLKTPEDPGDMLPVTFMVTPADARLSVDGQQIENEVSVELEIGEHDFTAKRENYQTLNKTITVDKQHVLFRFTLEEEQDALVQITSRPDGAKVLLDGVELGTTPTSSFYKPGRYPVEITKAGYVTIEDEYLEVKTPVTNKNYILEENVGYLTVKTRSEAKVMLNDEEVEANTRIKLNPKVIKITVSMPKAETIEETVVIRRNDDKMVELFPEIQTGSIQIAVTPFDAEITLNGDAGEHYTAEGSHVFNDIPVGTYELQISKEEFKTHKSTLTLTANDKITHSIKLEEGPDVSSDMVFVKGGCFTMGCTSEQSNCNDDEKPTHRVCVDDFYISRFEVTHAQYIAFLNDAVISSSGSKNGTEYIDMDDDDCAIGYRNGSFYFKGSSRADHENCPVIEVTWYGAEAYCKWAGGRLPTEAEWEYAARGGQESEGYKYSGSNNLDKVGWYSSNAGGETHAVGQKKANELGIYDMSGNVWEWCSDWYGSDYYSSSPERNPQGPSSGTSKVLRGGSWHGDASTCRVAYRAVNDPSGTINYDGFRFVQD